MKTITLPLGSAKPRRPFPKGASKRWEVIFTVPASVIIKIEKETQNGSK